MSQICGLAQDTLYHRLFECHCSQHARDKLQWKQGHDFLEEAQAGPFASKGQGLAEDHTWHQPSPAMQGDFKTICADLEFEAAFNECTHVFTDGGCTQMWHPKLNISTWSVVVSDCDGQHLAAYIGPV